MTAADECDILITRVYDAPVARVWAAWTDPAQLAQWWGPRGFTITTHHRDLRVGGMWDYTMHGPDGTDWPNFTRYLEVEPGVRLVYDHGATSADTAPMFRVTSTFRALGERTELTIRMTLPTPEAARETRGFIKAAGGNSTWDRLAEFVEKQGSAQEIFVIARSFDAPVERLFDLWTTPALLAEWLPPTGFRMHIHSADIRTGGALFFAMSNDAFTMHARHEYVVVERPERLEYLQRFTDEHGTVGHPPGVPQWPETLRCCVSFTSEGAAQSRVTVRTEIVGPATEAEVAAFVAERAGMTRGWTGSFDVLEGMLAG